jgi:isopentenyldiphosphate isomerase
MDQEPLVVVDPWDNIRGSAPRRRVHQEGLWHRGVHVLLFNRAGQVMVHRRSPRKAELPGLIDCTVSEHLRPGEAYRDAALRGLREGLGIYVPSLDLMVKFRMVYGTSDNMVAEVYRGTWESLPSNWNKVEIERVGFEQIGTLLQHGPQLTPWFLEILKWMTKRPSALTIL